MAKRRSLGMRESRKMFSRTAGSQKVHRKNFSNAVPMRGGIRL